jgi:hypothetical protein
VQTEASGFRLSPIPAASFAGLAGARLPRNDSVEDSEHRGEECAAQADDGARTLRIPQRYGDNKKSDGRSHVERCENQRAE